jgi:excisionase family DNA binding protein
MQDHEMLLTHAEAANRLRRSRHWLYVMAEGLGIPRIRVGGRWSYRPSDLEKWLDDNRKTGLTRPEGTRAGITL